MIEIVPESEGKLLGMKVRRSLTERDYAEALIPHLDWVVQQHGKARILLSMEKGVEGVDDESPWSPAKFGSKHKDQIEKLAVVGEWQWEDWALKAGDLLGVSEVKIFPLGQWERALDWITF